MYWRPIRKADLSHCLEIQPACLGDQIVGRRTALRVWKAFLDNPAFQATVIESELPIAGHKIVACGMGVFVTEHSQTGKSGIRGPASTRESLPGSRRENR